MWKSNKNGAEPPAEVEALAEIRSTTRGAFRLVYGFILQAVKGDKATANLILEDFLPENYPKNCCQSRGVASARIKQSPAHLTAILKRNGTEQGRALE
jgi:hypothetical protein